MDESKLAEPDLVSKRIRMIMGDRKISRKTLAEETGISRRSLARKLDSGTEFTYDELRRIIEALDLSWEELVAAPFRGASLTSPPRLRDLRSRSDRPL